MKCKGFWIKPLIELDKYERTMKETFEDYLQRLKDRRTEDNYKYTDEDFEKYKDYIKDCYQINLSVYKCLEFIWFQTEEAEDNFKKLNIIENGKQ